VISVQPTMNVAAQCRKFDARMQTAPSVDAAAYLAYCKGLLLASVAMGAPQPASNFIPMYEEEYES